MTMPPSNSQGVRTLSPRCMGCEVGPQVIDLLEIISQRGSTAFFARFSCFACPADSDRILLSSGYVGVKANDIEFLEHSWGRIVVRQRGATTVNIYNVGERYA